jgi:hypothetical protein
MPQRVGNAPLNAPQRVDRRSAWREAGFPLVILPKVIQVQWLQNLLHNQRALIVQAALLFKPSVIVTALPYHLER